MTQRKASVILCKEFDKHRFKAWLTECEDDAKLRASCFRLLNSEESACISQIDGRYDAWVP
jgi:hypothetical protein